MCESVDAVASTRVSIRWLGAGGGDGVWMGARTNSLGITWSTRGGSGLAVVEHAKYNAVNTADDSEMVARMVILLVTRVSEVGPLIEISEQRLQERN
jgi:uncharacterized membrane protein